MLPSHTPWPTPELLAPDLRSDLAARGRCSGHCNMARKARGLLLLLATAVLAPCLALSARPPCGSIDALRSGRALLVEAAKNDDVDTVKRHITEKKDLFFAIERAKCRTLVLYIDKHFARCATP